MVGTVTEGEAEAEADPTLPTAEGEREGITTGVTGDRERDQAAQALLEEEEIEEEIEAEGKTESCLIAGLLAGAPSEIASMPPLAGEGRRGKATKGRGRVRRPLLQSRWPQAWRTSFSRRDLTRSRRP